MGISHPPDGSTNGVKTHHYLMTGHTGHDWLTCTSYAQARSNMKVGKSYTKYPMKFN
jgi:hypothetical protein